MKSMNKNRVFTVELKMKESLKHITVTNGSGEGVFLEGSIGEFLGARFEEDVILEVKGTDGVIRVDLSNDEISGEESE